MRSFTDKIEMFFVKILLLFILIIPNIVWAEKMLRIAPLSDELGEFYIRMDTSPYNENYVSFKYCPTSRRSQIPCEIIGDEGFYDLRVMTQELRKDMYTNFVLSAAIVTALDMRIWSIVRNCSLRLAQKKLPQQGWLMKKGFKYGLMRFLVFDTIAMTASGIAIKKITQAFPDADFVEGLGNFQDMKKYGLQRRIVDERDNLSVEEIKTRIEENLTDHHWNRHPQYPDHFYKHLIK